MTTSGNWVYTISDNAVTITRYNGDNETSVTIPDAFEGYPVTIIGQNAFNARRSMQSVTIPNTVTTIEYAAFSYCSALKSIVIPNSVETIGESIFRGCSSLGSVTLPNSITTIPGAMFDGCKALTSITIPDSVTTIGNGAFQNCTSLTSITIPASVTTINYISTCFQYCSSLVSINVDENNPNYSSDDGILFNKDKTKLIKYPSSKTSNVSYEIPNTVTTLETYAFHECHSLTSITIPGSVSGIPSYTFMDCTSLTDISLPDSITVIEIYAFRNCHSLKTITLPKSLGDGGALYNKWFVGCESLTTISIDPVNANFSTVNGVLFNKNKTVLYVYPAGKTNTSYTIPDTVTSLPDYAFYGCKSIMAITVPNSVTSIGSINGYVFEDCTSLTSITLSNSIDTIFAHTFDNCTSLRSIIIPDSVTKIDNFAFSNCSSLSSVTLPNSLTEIGQSAFSNCSSLSSVTLPNSLTEIGLSAFRNCTSLTSITIPNNITTIQGGVFYGTPLSSVTIPDSVTTIEDNAFGGNPNLTSITIPASVTNLTNNICQNCTNLTAINVDSDNPNYCSEDGILFNKNKTTLITYPVGKTDTSYIIPDTVTAIGNAFRQCTYLVSIDIPDTVTSIGNSAFYHCTSLETLTLPPSITTLGAQAIQYCESLTSITIPDTITSITSSVFDGCKSLASIPVDANNPNYTSIDGVLYDKNVTTLVRYPPAKTDTTYAIPNTVTTLDTHSLSGITTLSVITVPASVSSMPNFTGDYSPLVAINVDSDNPIYCSEDGVLFNKTKTNLIKYPPAKTGSEYTIPNTVTIIGSGAFQNCKNLATVNFPNIEEITISPSAFCYASITSLDFPDSIQRLPTNCFVECKNLSVITLSNSFRLVEGSAFSGCTALRSITFPASVTFIGDYTFTNCSSLSTIKFEGTRCSIDGSNAFSLGKESTPVLCGVESPDNWATTVLKANSNEYTTFVSGTITMYKKFTYDDNKIQVESAVRDEDGYRIKFNYAKKTELDSYTRKDTVSNLTTSIEYTTILSSTSTWFIERFTSGADCVERATDLSDPSNMAIRTSIDGGTTWTNWTYTYAVWKV